ncbi:MAG: hypothetical protein FGM41_02745 [Bacteroidetes bacterium]|nr:hypothetical protein [Bacteroidota bacterium]
MGKEQCLCDVVGGLNGNGDSLSLVQVQYNQRSSALELLNYLQLKKQLFNFELKHILFTLQYNYLNL